MVPFQILRTDGGDELVVLARADFDALVAEANGGDEDAADAAAFDDALADYHADIHAGRAAVQPDEVAALMLKGDRRLTAWRRFRGLTQVDLAQMAGIGQGFLSQLEQGRKTGSPETLESLAQVLGARVEQIA
ncbi:helix-turn-helix transcriptional regulator [Brevundimonas sp.]|jgi:DNA-binding XRE family transcriptional regulator|uniref:helix-turn-helix domain-containing protein n=1 Tax=Brevundimonas sp. TaxID=1871086 RepID=UPI002E111752|nr:helix-turn-helix transcriptional regulator [Brevundimonas sp.]